jgi:23S rRNA (cytidine1920-2'-O)/16S rRNA (cytidine1409-2'-O)-methyltransferase
LPVKSRLDKLLVSRGLVSSRHQAQSLILARQVSVNGQLVDKAVQSVPDDAQVELKAVCPYVGRGGLKLEGALDKFSLPVDGKVALDVGASTGGFTDCLLKRGASKVYALDVGYGQLAWKLQQHPRVVVLDKTNVRYLKPADLGEPLELVTIDVSFISLTKVMPAILPLIKPDAEILALAKPQFEVGKGEVGRSGVVRSPQQHLAVLNKLVLYAESLGLSLKGICRSPLLGAKGNVEFFLYLTQAATASVADSRQLIEQAVEQL